jgi:hypothetical protein
MMTAQKIIRLDDARIVTEPVVTLPAVTVSTVRLESVKAHRASRQGNETFKHLDKDKQLWRVKAKYCSICGVCKQLIAVGEEITLFKNKGNWAHVRHAQL